MHHKRRRWTLIQQLIISNQSFSCFRFFFSRCLYRGSCPGESCRSSMYAVSVKSTVWGFNRKLTLSLGCRRSIVLMNQTSVVPLLQCVISFRKRTPWFFTNMLNERCHLIHTVS